MQIDHGRLQCGVTEVVGNLSHAHPSLKHVGSVGMTQGVSADVVMGFMQPTFDNSHFHSTPNCGIGHVVGASVHGLAYFNAGAFPSTTHAGEEPVGVFMKLPKSPKSDEQFR